MINAGTVGSEFKTTAPVRPLAFGNPETISVAVTAIDSEGIVDVANTVRVAPDRGGSVRSMEIPEKRILS